MRWRRLRLLDIVQTGCLLSSRDETCDPTPSHSTHQPVLPGRRQETKDFCISRKGVGFLGQSFLRLHRIHAKAVATRSVLFRCEGRRLRSTQPLVVQFAKMTR